MKAAISAAAMMAVVLVSIGSTLLLTGCQIPGKVLSTETSSVCPACKTQTVTSPIKGLTYTKHICPMCKSESTINPEQGEILRDYVGLTSDMKTVHVCAHCKAVISTCPMCRKQ